MGASLAEAKRTILCVDDEATPMMLRRFVLEKSGFCVLTAASGQEALQILEQQPVDLVLTDLLMPGLSGSELAQEVKRRKPDLPVVLLSGVNEIPEDATAADLFLSKVEGPEAMCRKLAEILNRSRDNAA
jgi:CheY-like chemotaxis protein